jgi:hypothetical protein
MQLNIYYEAYDLPGTQSHASTSISGTADAADGGGESTFATPKS